MSGSLPLNQTAIRRTSFESPKYSGTFSLYRVSRVSYVSPSGHSGMNPGNTVRSAFTGSISHPDSFNISATVLPSSGCRSAQHCNTWAVNNADFSKALTEFRAFNPAGAWAGLRNPGTWTRFFTREFKRERAGPSRLSVCANTKLITSCRKSSSMNSLIALKGRNWAVFFGMGGIIPSKIQHAAVMLFPIFSAHPFRKNLGAMIVIGKKFSFSTTTPAARI